MLKLGCVSYMNALPLTHGLNPKEVELISRPPAQLLYLLQGGEVEAALLPIVNYFENPDLYLVPGLAIACRGAVKSVRLYWNNITVGAAPRGRPQIENEPSQNSKGRHSGLPLQNIHTIYLDPESRTSHALLKVILQHKYGMDLNTLTFTSDLSHPHIDAKLLIGDKTFTENGSALDLGEEWCSWQQKPFVFAAWMSLQKKPELHQKLQESFQQGFKQIDTIIDKLSSKGWRDWGPPNYRQQSASADDAVIGGEERQDPLDKVTLREYFTKNLHYTMGEAELDGIRRFYELLKPIQGYTHELDFKFVS